MKKSYYIFFTFLLFCFFIFNLTAVEVGGHLYEDTIWSPDDNPYYVTDNLYVDAGVTLTILPGTEVRIGSAYCMSSADFYSYFYLHNGNSVAKMIWVTGKIVARGTVQDSITFTRLHNDPEYCWGVIYCSEQTAVSEFEYCNFEHSAGMRINTRRSLDQVLSCYNGKIIAKSCTFVNNKGGIGVESSTRYAEIINNIFTQDYHVNPYIFDTHKQDLSVRQNTVGFSPALIAENQFLQANNINVSSANFVNNFITNTNSTGLSCSALNDPCYIYQNEFFDCRTGLDGSQEESTIYIKNNHFVDGNEGVCIDDAYAEITDNHFELCRLTVNDSPLSQIINNLIENQNVQTTLRGNVGVITNNIIVNCAVAISGSGASQFANNLIINNETICTFFTDISEIENQIIICNESIFQYTNSVHGFPVFRNCILDFELPEGCIDGGGNFWVNPFQAQELFVDILNGNFHLASYSIAIDAGFNTPYYYPFDLDHNQRVWDGNGNGQARIDIGPYEYNSPSTGGVQGITYNPVNGDPVDYVLIKLENEPGEFTFSDSIGNFVFKLPAGIYDICAERVFFDEVIEYQIEVFTGLFTQLDFSMFETVEVEENEILSFMDDIHLTNYPNPFNPATTISFELNTETAENTELVIYNLKGQKVKTFLINSSTGQPINSVIWNGTDDSSKPVSSGIYFAKLKSGNQKFSRKMLLLK